MTEIRNRSEGTDPSKKKEASSSSGSSSPSLSPYSATASGTHPPEANKSDFHWTSHAISHPRRRKAILSLYPEIEELYGYDIREGIIGTLVLIVNLFIGLKIVSVYDMSWLSVFLLTFIFSGTFNHILFLCMHEASHCCLFPTRILNEIFTIAANTSMGAPAGMGFIRYHIDHHIYLGVDKYDPDIPSKLEGYLFSKNFFTKLIFILLLPLTYIFRPLLRNPKKMVYMEVINWIVVLSWDAYIFYYHSYKTLFYFLGGSLISMSFHPLNGHLIAEHYQFPWGEKLQETFSCYGFIDNFLTFNSGYHIEHHDFPQVPGLRLPAVHEKAKEFYDLPCHESWWKTIILFLIDPEVTPFSRVKRISTHGGQVQKPHRLFEENENENLGKFWELCNQGQDKQK